MELELPLLLAAPSLDALALADELDDEEEEALVCSHGAPSPLCLESKSPKASHTDTSHSWSTCLMNCTDSTSRGVREKVPLRLPSMLRLLCSSLMEGWAELEGNEYDAED